MERPTRLPLILLSLLLGSFLIFWYVEAHRLGYVSAPGGDLYNHAQNVFLLQDEGLRAFTHGYPKLFHLMVLIGMKLTGRNPLVVMLGLFPLVQVAAAGMAFLLMRRLGSVWTGLVAAVLVLWVSGQPLQTLYDGGFPNYISASIWLPMTLLGITELARRRTLGIILSVCGVLAVLLTHHFSVFYVLIFALSVIWIQRRYLSRNVWYGVAGAVLLLLSPLAANARDLLASVVQVGSGFPWVHLVGHLDNPNAILPLRAYPEYFNPMIFWVGLITMALVLTLGKKAPLALKILAIWAVALLLASRVEAVGFPVRLARDAGVPLAMLAAYGLGWLGHKLAEMSAGSISLRAIAVLLTVPVVVIVSLATLDRITRLTTFDPIMQYTPAQAALVEQIQPGEAAGAVNQLLPSVVNRQIKPLFFDGTEADNLAQLQPLHAVLVVDSQDATYDSALQLLQKSKFRQVAVASDVMRTVYLWRR